MLMGFEQVIGGHIVYVNPTLIELVEYISPDTCGLQFGSDRYIAVKGNVESVANHVAEIMLEVLDAVVPETLIAPIQVGDPSV